MSVFAIRPARSTDAGKVGAILSAFIDETDWLPRIHTRAEDVGFAGQMIDAGWMQVAETNGKVTGFLARNAVEIHALYVAPDARGQGIGSALLEAAKSVQPDLELWTFQANTGARKFYLAHGFVERERTDGAGNDEHLPDIRYVWSKGEP